MDELELKKTRDSLYFWNIVATIVFITIIIKTMMIAGNGAVRIIASMSPFHFFVISFATFRMTRLLVADHITQWMRDLCMESVIVKDPMTGAVFVRCEKPIKGLRRLISDFLGCPWCVGVWMALVSVVLYYLAAIEFSPFAWIIIIVFAIAGSAELIYAIVVALLAPHVVMGFPMDQKGANLLGGQKRPTVAPPVSSPNVCVDCGVGIEETK